MTEKCELSESYLVFRSSEKMRLTHLLPPPLADRKECRTAAGLSKRTDKVVNKG